MNDNADKQPKKQSKNVSLDVNDILPALKRSAPKLLAKLGFILILVALGLVIAAAILVNLAVFNTPDDDEYRLQKQSEAIVTNFDRATIEKIELLNQRNDADNVRLPPGDINPFQ